MAEDTTCANPTCKKTFKKTSNGQKYHAANCRNEHRRVLYPKAEIPARDCKFCGESFVPQKNHALFCSPAHQAAFNNRSRRIDADADTIMPPAQAAKRRVHPTGWEPGVEWNGKTGTVTSRPTDEMQPNWDSLLTSWGFDPTEFEVVEPVQIRTWDAWFGGEQRQMWYYRAQIRQRTASRIDSEELERLRAEILKHRPRRREAPVGTHTLVVPVSDWQMGKGDGDGVEGTVQRVLEKIDAVTVRLAELRKIGRDVDEILLAGVGDMTENCAEFYPMQQFTVEIDRRAQNNLVRRLLIKAITTWAPHVSKMMVTTVPGNHGENRKDGKAFTTFGDNDDVAVFEQVADVIRASESYANVGFAIPANELTVQLSVRGHVVGIAHGHQARGGGTLPEQKIENWMKKQALGMRPVADATVLITGHYHHLIVKQLGPRLWVQCPSLEGGSEWFEEGMGIKAPTGQLTFLLSERGWSDLAVL